MSEYVEKWKQEISLEFKKIELEKTKAKWDFWKTLVVSGASAIAIAVVTAFGSIYVGYLNNESAKEIELIKIDSGLTTAFGAQFLSEDLGTRIRAAHLFKSIAPSVEIRSRWSPYHEELAAFNEAIIKAGGDPSSSIRSLLNDDDFLKNWGGMGCRMDSMDGCIANMPSPGSDLYPAIQNPGKAIPG
ncbi:hypothetical protein EJC49_21415 [Aquibium carbonis]|uniref:Uncharacterized protein n=1 Tax=Aquibium carbonis TaxID=2495581 RepID=A0A3R9YC42_9HYPH|nr:hypothetical protein [Aquibium carbonis]RST84312.1 hypothetical protein EJC49_21415 [Aquibium carbonis]